MALLGHQALLNAVHEGAGDVPWTVTPSGTMEVTRSLVGDSSWSMDSTFADMDLRRNFDTGDSSWTVTPTGTMVKSRPLTGDSSWSFTPNGVKLERRVNAAGNASWSFTPSGTMLGVGVLAGDATFTFTPEAPVPDVVRYMAGDSSWSFTPSAPEMRGVGVLAGDSSHGWTPSGTMEATRNMAGDSSWSFTPSGQQPQKGHNNNSGAVSFAFTPAAGSMEIPEAEVLAGSASTTFTPTGTMALTANSLLTVDFLTNWQTWITATQDPPATVEIPTQAVQDYVTGSVTCVTRRVDIFESDGTTSYLADAAIISGAVTLSMASAERRTMELVLDGCDVAALEVAEGSLWYDKVITISRGADPPASPAFTGKIGTFLIDRVSRSPIDHTVTITGRDFTKKMLGSKFGFTTFFAANEPIENIISVIATNAGIVSQSLPLTGQNSAKPWTFDAGTDRWVAISEIATAHGYDIYFDVDGTLVMALFADIANDPITYVFQTGLSVGNLSGYTKTITDARIKNHIVIRGESPSGTPIIAEARNVNPASPTRIAALGERTDIFESSFVSDLAQAQSMADNLLTISGLDSFEVPLTGIVVPWLDVNSIVTFVDPEPVSGDPTRFLMTDIQIPMTLDGMGATIRRVVSAQ